MSANRTRFIITVLFILCLVPSTVSSQIQRNFWGLELGRSTKSEVKRAIESKGWQCEQNMGGMDAIGVVDDVSLGGYKWNLSFRFYDNKLCEIQLMFFHIGLNRYGEYTDESGNNTFTFYDLKRKLKDKYPKVEDIVDHDNPHMVILRDNQTLLMLELSDEKDVVLSYGDRILLRSERDGGGL